MASSRLDLIAPHGFPLVSPGDDIAAMIVEALAGERMALLDGDIVVVAQKIISKSENRYVALDAVVPGARAMELAARAQKDPRIVELILSESREVLRCVPGVLIVETVHGFVLANAGIDRSNVSQLDGESERVLLLPKDPDGSARRLRQRLREIVGADVHVIINDSLGRAWRNGTIGTALGVSGVSALKDLRGVPDLFGYSLRTTEIAFADELASAASVLMGQSHEGRPIVLIRGVAAEGAGQGADLIRDKARDLFR